MKVQTDWQRNSMDRCWLLQDRVTLYLWFPLKREPSIPRQLQELLQRLQNAARVF